MATMAINSRQNFSFLQRISAGFSQITKNLMGTTSLVPAQVATKSNDNPFGGFGVLASADKFKSNPKPVSKSSFLFSVEDAKNRIVELVENKFKPENLNDLMGYLSSKLLKLETWKLPPGPINMLVDTKTNQAVVAKSAHNSLSYEEVLKTQIRGDLVRDFGNMEPATAYGSWEGMSMSMSNSRSNLGYIVVKGQAYVGKVYASGTDNRSLIEISEAAKKDGIALILPTTDGTINGDRIEGLPVLNKERSLKAEEVHPGLSHDVLKRKFENIGLLENIESKMVSKRNHEAELGAGHEAQQAFDMSQFMKTSSDSFEHSFEDRNVSSFGDFSDDYVSNIQEEKRNLSIRLFAGNSYVVYDRDFNEETQIKFEDMPAGRYERENERGFIEGYTMISDTGELTHYNRKGKLVEFDNKIEENLDAENKENNAPKFGM